MVTYYKAVRPNGTDFSTGKIDYAAAVGTEQIVKHPNPVRSSENAADYLSVSVAPGDCTGFSYSVTSPARLFEVKPVGRAWTPHKSSLPNKRAVASVRVIRELPAHMLFGPQGEAVVEMLLTFSKLTSSQRSNLYWKRPADWHRAWQVVSDGRANRAGLRAAQDALRGLLYGFRVDGTAYGAALAVLLRHTIGKDGLTQAHYDALTKLWVTVTGRTAHPEDVMF